MSAYHDKLREHEFDGIHEFDNYLPKWWLWTFYLACIFAVIYWVYYHGSRFGMSATANYSAQMQARMLKEASEKPVTRELLEDFAKQPANIAAGKKLFETVCHVCHKKDGSGLAGPNLTDRFWIHGGRIDQVYATVAKGSPTNATMVAWEPTLKRTGVMQVVAYVMTMKNTNLPGRAPEGKPEEEK